jgi:hypothetical protein
MADELTPEQLADLNIRRRQIRERSNLGNAQQDYLFQSAHKEYGRNLNDIMYAYARAREKLPYSFARRGLLNSGIYAKNLAYQNQDVQKAVTDLSGRTQDQLQGYLLAKQQLGQVTTGGLQDIDELQTSRIATVAAALRQAGL